MDTLSVARVCFRRWFVFVPVLLIGLLAVVRVSSTTQQTYTSTGSLVLLPPATVAVEGVERQINPYTQAGGSGRLLASALVADLSSVERRGTLAVGGTNYEAVQRRNEPVIDLIVTGSRAEDVDQAIGGLVEVAPTLLRDIQTETGAPADALLRAELFSPIDPPVETTPARTKLLLALVGLAVAAAAAGALLFDAALRVMPRRGSRQRRVRTEAVLADARRPEPVHG